MKPYVYYIKHLSTETKYIGCKYAKNADPATFWKNYFTSSKKVADLRKYFGNEDFEISIRKVFTTKDECIAYETRLLRKLNAAKHPDFLNEHNNDNANVKWSKKKRQAVGNKNKKKVWITNGIEDKRIDHDLPIPDGFRRGSKKKGKPTGKRGPEFCEKMRQIALSQPPVSDETKKKQSAWQKGKTKKPHSEETKEKLRGERGPYGPQKKYKCAHCEKDNMSTRHIKFCKGK